jgi:hypothetical protein
MHEFLGLLRHNRKYRYTWMGQVVSEIGDNFNNIAVFALAMALTHSGLVIMGVMLSRAIPAIAIGRWHVCCSSGLTVGQRICSIYNFS